MDRDGENGSGATDDERSGSRVRRAFGIDRRFRDETYHAFRTT
jgi:hypothetical protein